MVPIWAAAVAYSVYDEKLQPNHWVGMGLLTMCMTLISLSDLIGVDTRVTLPVPENAEGIESLMYKPVTPVVLAFFATLLLGLNMNIVKYFDKKGFPADVFAFGCYGATNLIQACLSIAIFY